MRTILLLTISNVFMTFVRYGHLKYSSEALRRVILASWGIAFLEYCLQGPANRIGSYEFSTDSGSHRTGGVCSVPMVYLGEKLKWNHAAGFAWLILGVFFVFHRW